MPISTSQSAGCYPLPLNQALNAFVFFLYIYGTRLTFGITRFSVEQSTKNKQHKCSDEFFWLPNTLTQTDDDKFTMLWCIKSHNVFTFTQPVFWRVAGLSHNMKCSSGTQNVHKYLDIISWLSAFWVFSQLGAWKLQFTITF